jgi:hypothetical protein
MFGARRGLAQAPSELRAREDKERRGGGPAEYTPPRGGARRRVHAERQDTAQGLILEQPEPHGGGEQVEEAIVSGGRGHRLSSRASEASWPARHSRSSARSEAPSQSSEGTRR